MNQKTFIVIAQNTNGVQRAFIKDTAKKANNLVNDLLGGGWFDGYVLEVDKVMIETIALNVKQPD